MGKGAIRNNLPIAVLGFAAAVVATAVPVPQSAALSAPRQTSKGGAILLLGAIFSMIVAFNLAFFRHLRREYASPR
jgi:heme/copper-type cytochrome/quinol oxidase subunit 4